MDQSRILKAIEQLDKKLTQKIESNSNAIERLDNKLTKRFDDFEKDINIRFAGIETRFSQIETRLDEFEKKTEERFDRMFNLIDKVMGELKTIRQEQIVHTQRHDDLDKKIKELERKFATT